MYSQLNQLYDVKKVFSINVVYAPDKPQLLGSYWEPAHCKITYNSFTASKQVLIISHKWVHLWWWPIGWNASGDDVRTLPRHYRGLYDFSCLYSAFVCEYPFLLLINWGLIFTDFTMCSLSFLYATYRFYWLSLEYEAVPLLSIGNLQRILIIPLSFHPAAYVKKILPAGVIGCDIYYNAWFYLTFGKKIYLSARWCLFLYIWSWCEVFHPNVHLYPQSPYLSPTFSTAFGL